MLRLRLSLLFIALSLLSGCTIMLNPENGGAAFPSNGAVAASEPSTVAPVGEPAVPAAENPPTVGISLPPVVRLRPDLRPLPVVTTDPPKVSDPPVRQVARPGEQVEPVQVCRNCVKRDPPRVSVPKQRPPKAVQQPGKRNPPRPPTKSVPGGIWTPTRLASR